MECRIIYFIKILIEDYKVKYIVLYGSYKAKCIVY